MRKWLLRAAVSAAITLLALAAAAGPARAADVERLAMGFYCALWAFGVVAAIGFGELIVFVIEELATRLPSVTRRVGKAEGMRRR